MDPATLRDQIAENLASVRGRIAQAAERSGRDVADVTLVVITKTFGLPYLQAAYDLGLRHLGENRVEEAMEKFPAFEEWLAGRPKPTWHMVGHLQRRKARDAIELFDLIHSVDSLRLAERIDRLCQREGLGPVPILLEVNTSGEEQKYGFALHRWREDKSQWSDFLSAAEGILALPHVQVRGLMTMAPFVESAATRPFFRCLRDIREALAQTLPGGEWRELSMGMSNDFEIAVEEGATMLRLGRAVLGPRGGVDGQAGG